MKKYKVLLLALPAVVFVVSTVTAPLSVFAEEGTSDTTTTSESDTSKTDRAKELRKKAEERRAESKEKAKTLLQEARAQHGTKTAEARQAACEERKSGLEQKVENLNTNAQKYLNKVDDVLEKAKAFKTEKNLTVDNYDQLVADAEASGATAAASVEALEELKPTIDCASGAVANDVATFKAAAQQARTDLKAYKTDVKELLTALKAAAGATESEEQ